MLHKIATSLLALLFLSPIANAAEEKIENALSAAPASLSRHAKVMDWDGKVLRKGSNGYTCLPDIPDNGANDPWCVVEPPQRTKEQDQADLHEGRNRLYASR